MTVASTSAAYSSPATNAPASRSGPRPVSPPRVRGGAVGGAPELELRERPGQIHVGEDEVRLGRLVGAADEDGIGAVADELDPLQVGDEPLHDEREHALPAERVDRGVSRG